jgi:type I restriction enzyme, R subunit
MFILRGIQYLVPVRCPEGVAFETVGVSDSASHFDFEKARPATVVKAIIEIRRDMEEADARAASLGLDEEELAFYESVEANYQQIYGQELLRDLIHEVVLTIKRNLKVEWTEPHHDDVKAAVRAAFRRVLRRRNIKTEDFDRFLSFIMEQAEALYADWPLAA